MTRTNLLDIEIKCSLESKVFAQRVKNKLKKSKYALRLDVHSLIMSNRDQRIQRKSPCNMTIVLSALKDFRIVVIITCRFFKNLEINKPLFCHQVKKENLFLHCCRCSENDVKHSLMILILSLQ